MGKFKKISDLIENSVPEFKNLRVIPRGALHYPDTMMSGTVRFGRRLGNNLSVLNPDNELTLSANASLGDLSLVVEHASKWWEYGALLSFNGIEMYELRDWDNLTNTVVLTNSLTSNRFTGEKLYLWAVPLQIHADAPSGDHQVVVRSKHPILNGDVITFPVSDTELSSLVEIEVLLASEAGASGNPDYPILYNLILKKTLPQALSTQNLCYLRAFPGYKSKEVRVPKTNYGQMGPFILDYMATPLNSKVKYEETFAIRALDGGNIPVVGTVNSYKTVSKNTPLADRPLWADAFLFWDIVKGSAGFTLPNKFKLKTDTKGKGKVFKKLVPELPSGNTWEFKVQPSSSGVLRVNLSPYGFQDFNLTANVQQTITVSTPPGGTVDQVSIVLNMASPSAFVEFSNWNLKGSVVDTLQYTQVYKVLGSFNFQATSLIIKPYFLSLSDLNIDYDNGSQYNSGAIYL